MNNSPALQSLRALWRNASLLAPAAVLAACTSTGNTVLELSKTAPTVSEPSLIVNAGIHACAQTADGNAYCWGQGEFGQLGDGATGTQTRPTQVPGLGDVKQLATSRDGTCALENDGTVVCFGSNEFCQLGAPGDGTTYRASAPREGIDIGLHPIPVAGLANAVQIAVNDVGGCAVIADGSVKCWGRPYAHPGLPREEQHCDQTLAAVPDLTGVTQVRAYGTATCALRNDGTIWCWLGNPGLDESLGMPPHQAARVGGVQQFAMGGQGINDAAPQMCALIDDGSVVCLGANEFGQLGAGDSLPHDGPVTVAGIPAATRIFGTGARFCALGTDAKLYCWGAEYASTPEEQANLGPQRCATGNGDQTLPCRTSPAAVEGLADVIDATVGDAFSCAVSNDGTVRCFGVASQGDLGDGTTDQRLAGPTLVQF